MLLLVDMPRVTENTPAGARTAPYCVPIAPEAVSDYRIGSDGRFEWVEFPGVYTAEDGETLDIISSALHHFAERSGIENIETFVRIYESCLRSGGDFVSAIHKNIRSHKPKD